MGDAPRVLLLDLQADGIQAGVLDVPRATELEAAAPNLVTFRKALRTALAKNDITLWSFPDYWPADYFCEMVHFNRDGAVAFDKSFSDRLQQALHLPQ